MKFIKITLAASLLALATAPALAATPDNALVVAQNIDDIVTIDPATAYEFSSGEYVTNTYDQLVQYDATDTETLAPGLATAWEIDAARRTITSRLATPRISTQCASPLGGTTRCSNMNWALSPFRCAIRMARTPSRSLGWMSGNGEPSSS